MYTIPMRAQKSNSSWSNQSGTGLGPSLRVIQRTTRGERRRFIFSVGLFVFTLVGLIGGGVDNILQSASAIESPQWATEPSTTKPSSTQPEPSSTRSTPSGSSTQPSSQPSSQPASTTPTSSSQPISQPPTTSTAPTPSSTAIPAPTAAPAKKTIQPVQYYAAPVKQSSSEVISSTTPDTSGDITTMSAAQSEVPTIPVTYTSGRISDATRDRLLLLAASALVSAAVIYIMSLFGASGSSLSYGNRTSEATTH